MIGNSSSGIVEAASFALPVVNIGNRQQGRLRARNVIDVGHSRSEITVGVHRAMSREFRAGLTGLENPYGDGRASDRIVERLRSVKLTNELLRKHFHRL
jgi:UDP-N-acetylglucosamine 2-epimerase